MVDGAGPPRQPALRGRMGIPFPAYLAATAVLCGALVMVVEVLGSRVLGPFFGVSLFVWTSLITVTLLALAAGYACGGLLADRRGRPEHLYALILAAGLFVLVVPLCKATVLKACVPLGLRGGALASALLLFGPCLFLLGAVSPFVIRLAAREMSGLGRTVGLFTALSTLGSFLGTLLTGFVLIAWLGVNRIFEVSGLLLAGCAVLYFFLFPRRSPAVLLLLIPLALLSPSSAPVSKVMPSGTTASLIYDKDSFYGTVKVVDYRFGDKHTRELMIDGLLQGGVDVASGLSVYEYSYLLEMLPRHARPDGRSCLVIGLGAGVVPRWYERQGVRTDVVDIDPEVVDVARHYFDFRLQGDVVVADARHYLAATDRKYDYLILDVFNGDTTPGHLLTREALLLMRERMTARGVLAANIVAGRGENNLMTTSVIRTLESVFTHVEIYPLCGDEEVDSGNMTIIAYSFPPAGRLLNIPAGYPVHEMAREVLTCTLAAPAPLPRNDAAFILTDDYDPIDFYDRKAKENVRRAILNTTDWDILI